MEQRESHLKVPAHTTSDRRGTPLRKNPLWRGSISATGTSIASANAPNARASPAFNRSISLRKRLPASSAASVGLVAAAVSGVVMTESFTGVECGACAQADRLRARGVKSPPQRMGHGADGPVGDRVRPASARPAAVGYDASRDPWLRGTIRRVQDETPLRRGHSSDPTPV